MADEMPPARLLIPPENLFNIQAKKYYIFNETGNIMMASTEDESGDLDQSARDIFAEVSVFFAAMTRAITTTENPATGEPYSIYNYTALRKIIAGSGLFVHVMQTDLYHETSAVGATFSKELLEGLLGLATGAGALSFAQGMLASIGQEGLRMGRSKSETENKVANIIFVCEYLLGMPTVSALVVYADVEENKDAFEFGPCIKIDSQSNLWKMHKDTYLFVTPKFIREYSADLDTVGSNVEYNQLVEYLRSTLTDTPEIHSVVDDAGNKVKNNTFEKGKSYKVMGNNLSDAVSVKLGETGAISGASGANYGSIGFSISPTAQTMATPTALEVYNEDDEKMVTSVDQYTIA